MDPVVNRDRLYVPVAAPTIGVEEIEAVVETMRSGWISQGPKVKTFEAMFAAAHDRRFGVACNSGTTALRLSLAAMDIGMGDVVVCPTMTMVAVPNSIIEARGVPHFVDSEPTTGNMDPMLLLDAIRRHRPKAVVYAHLYGVPGNLEPVPEEILIEDCSEAHYGRCGDKSVGSSGAMATFSFYANKIITTGEGGMVITDDPVKVQRLVALRSHAFTEGDHFCHQELAFGFRLTDIALR